MENGSQDSLHGKTVVVTPAYGKNYKTLDEVLSDWEAGKDFRIVSLFFMGSYMSIRDAKKYNLEVYCRYNGNTLVAKIY